jgi:hypothetical protein
MVLAAASAVSGCMTVSQPAGQAGSGQSSGPPLPSSVTPVVPTVSILQLPAHEVLGTFRPEPPAATGPTAPPAGAPARSRPRLRSRTAAPVAPRPRARLAAPPAAGANVCELGKVYGGWASNSDAARICGEAYGN